MMNKFLLTFLLQFVLIGERLTVAASQCSIVPSCTSCDLQARAVCTGVCPSKIAIPRDIKELKIIKYTCSPDSLVIIKSEDWGNYPALEELDLSNNGIKTLYYGPPRNLSTFVNMPNLRVISLAHNLITSFKESTFTNLTHLVSLDMSHNSLVGLVTGVASGGWPSLKTLNLTNNNIKSLTPISLAGVKELEILLLSNNPISDISDDAFRSLTHLHTIKIDGLPMKEIPAAIFANPQTLKEVVASNMSVSTLGDNILHETSLDKLDLSDDQFTSIPTTAIKNSAIQPKTLDLSNNKITQISSTDLQGLTVVKLDLSGNPIVDIGYKAFEGCTISHIDLSNTGLTSLPTAMETWLKSTTATVNLDTTNWSCSCDTLWLARLVDQKANITPPKCAASDKYGGKSIKDALPQMEKDCNQTTKRTAIAQVSTLIITTTGIPQALTPFSGSFRINTSPQYLTVVGILFIIMM